MAPLHDSVRVPRQIPSPAFLDDVLQPARLPEVNHLSIPLLQAALALAAAVHGAPHSRLDIVAPNENRIAAGTLKGNLLDVSLEVRSGTWFAYGPGQPAVSTLAFGEKGKPLQMPGPLIRVRAGTRIHARVSNTAGKTLVVHGLSARRVAAMDTLVIPSGEVRDATFTADEAGTFYYWASTEGESFNDRIFDDGRLSGALIVDSAGATPRPDRVFVVQWYMPGKDKAGAPDNLNGFFTFNGLPWPQSERLSFAQGDSVHWRMINTTPDVHPLHLHGFYFRVTARGDMQRDTAYWRAQERMGVTELLAGGTTADISWLADRPGGWVFHCHLNWHVVPNPTLGAGLKKSDARLKELFATSVDDDDHASHAMANHAEKGMGGLLIAVTIKPKAAWRPYTGQRERLRLYIKTDSLPADTARRFGYVLARGTEMPTEQAVQWPGPTIVLHKGEPTSIWVINQTKEPSQVHWHGLEVDSYYDGVAGLSSNGDKVSPMIMPRDSFEVTVTPPRAGSFMYHTHINDLRQQSHGLYGAIVVLDAGQTWNPATDLIFQVSANVTDDAILNGSATPPEMTLHVGQAYRMRLMNISLDEWDGQLWLVAKDGRSGHWTAMAKDGFDLPPWQRTSVLARQAVSIGETYDFQTTFAAPGEYELQGRDGAGAIFAHQVIHVVK